MSDGWTYGVELEWPDISVRTELPDGWSWSRTDYTVVNSDGVANDPRHELVLRGGELNSPPFETPGQIGDAVEDMARLLWPGHNYRSNTHIHVRVPELLEDVGLAKRVAEYSREFLPALLYRFDSLDGLMEEGMSDDELGGAYARMRHSEKSRHYFCSETRHRMRMQASTLEEFLAAEVPRDKAGRPCWALASREAVNLRSLRKHGTVEFRCFAGSRSGEEITAAAYFCFEWLTACLDNTPRPGKVLGTRLTKLPHQVVYDHQLETGWQYTNLHNNSRDVVRQRLQEMGKLA